MAYIKIDETNRIIAASYNFHCGDGEIEVTIPEDVPFENIHDYLYDDGEWIYDPIPEEVVIPEPTASDILNALLGVEV